MQRTEPIVNKLILFSLVLALLSLLYYGYLAWIYCESLIDIIFNWQSTISSGILIHLNIFFSIIFSLITFLNILFIINLRRMKHINDLIIYSSLFFPIVSILLLLIKIKINNITNKKLVLTIIGFIAVISLIFYNFLNLLDRTLIAYPPNGFFEFIIFISIPLFIIPLLILSLSENVIAGNKFIKYLSIIIIFYSIYLYMEGIHIRGVSRGGSGLLGYYTSVYYNMFTLNFEMTFIGDYVLVLGGALLLACALLMLKNRIKTASTLGIAGMFLLILSKRLVINPYLGFDLLERQMSYTLSFPFMFEGYQDDLILISYLIFFIIILLYSLNKIDLAYYLFIINIIFLSSLIFLNYNSNIIETVKLIFNIDLIRLPATTYLHLLPYLPYAFLSLSSLGLIIFLITILVKDLTKKV